MLFIFLLFSFGNSFAGNIVALTSLPDEDVRAEQRIESIVNSSMPAPSGHQLLLINKANMETLYFHLNSPDTFALFWVGHGAYKKAPSGKGMEFAPVLLDYQKTNIAPAFKRVHPNIKFLGIIGCNSSQILNLDDQYNSELGLYLPRKKVVASWGMKRAIKALKRHLNQTREFTFQQDIQGAGRRIRITRIAPDNPSSLLVFAGKTLIGLLPKPLPGEEQVQDFFIPEGESSLKIIMRSGQNPFDSTDRFGKITIENADQEWRLFAGPDGIPFGTNERIFMFWGDREKLEPAETYFIFRENN